MRKALPRRTTVAVLLIWTVGVVALWVIADAVLNEGVSEADIQECVEEGFIPRDECEEALEMLEADEDPVIGIGASMLVWLAGFLVLLWLLTRPRPTGTG
jgi:hypothetical protein